MRSTRCSLAVALVAGTFACAAAPSARCDPPAEGPAPVPLHAAVAAGTVEARGANPSSYRGVQLTLRNVSAGPLAVECSGSHVEPETKGACQRLGLGPAKPHPKVRKGPRTVIVDLDAGEQATLAFGTCCLDVRLAGATTQRFVGAREPLAPETAAVLRWWAANPETPQGSVNAAVWKRQLEVDPSGGSARPSRRLAGHGGVVYQITEDGHLSSLDAAGVRRPLGSDIDSAFPTDQALYAVWRRRGGFDLYRLATTGEEGWVPVADLGEDSVLSEVLDLGSAGLLLLGPKSVRRVRPDGSVAAVQHAGTAGAPTAHAAGRGRVELVLHKERSGRGLLGHVVDLAPGALETDAAKPHWEQRLVIAGPGGLFALTHAGRLERRAGGGFRPLTLPTTFDTLLFVGRRHLWGLTTDRRLVSVDLERGALRATADLPPAELDGMSLTFTQFSIDGATDDLLRVTSSTWQRIRAADGVVEALPAP